MILVVVIAIIKFLYGFSELIVHFYQFFQGLFEKAVLLLEVSVAILELLEFALAGEVVLESAGHDIFYSTKLEEKSNRLFKLSGMSTIFY